MIELASLDLCTGCGACAYVCPKACISMVENEIGVVYPVLDMTICIECKRCQHACPILNPVSFRKSEQAYAAWSTDEKERHTSASGGVAIELYKQAIANGYKCVGASQNDDFSVTHKFVSTIDDLQQFKNSKYVFSDAYDVYPDIKAALKIKEKVVFIGLPCQVAALRRLFSDNENLLLVEMVCHGTTPVSYLKQHIEKINKQCKDNAVKMSFRDPCLFTSSFTFTLYNAQGERFYAKRTKNGDTYQYGYHRAVTYRENCYHCRFAKPERCADITIADYHGLGLLAPADFNPRKVSLILVNTIRGCVFVRELLRGGHIIAHARPLQEPVLGEPQLNYPSVKKEDRRKFEQRIYEYKGDFETAIAPIAKAGVRKEKYKELKNVPKRIVRKFINLWKRRKLVS